MEKLENSFEFIRFTTKYRGLILSCIPIPYGGIPKVWDGSHFAKFSPDYIICDPGLSDEI